MDPLKIELTDGEVALAYAVIHGYALAKGADEERKVRAAALAHKIWVAVLENATGAARE